MSAGPEPVPVPRRSLVVASAILAVATILGVAFTRSPIGVVAGPVIDMFATPRLLRRAGLHYRSPGAPLWSPVFAAVAVLPALGAIVAAAIGSSSDWVTSWWLLANVVAAPALVLGLVGLRNRPYRRLATSGIGGAVAVGLLGTVGLLAGS
jgi:hypothetical protein